MPKRNYGFLLILTLIVAAGALVQDYRFSTSLARERDGALALERDLSSLDIAIANLRGAQAGYVAMGQAPAAATSRAVALTSEIEATLARLRRDASEPAAQTRYDAAIAAFGELSGFDTRARAYVNSDRRYEASDLIFGDSADPLQRLNASLAEVRSAERQSADARMATAQRLQLAVVIAAVMFLLAVALFFWRVSSRATADTAPVSASVLDLASAPVPPPAAREVPAAVKVASEISLTDAAELCVDLARVIDGRDVPALLERAADVLGAKGAILWVADTDRETLRPSFACGYSEKVLARLGSLPVSADNVTSLAYRSMRAHVLGATPPATRGAIAVPLMTSAGCVGVLAAEINQSRPDQDTLAVARMIAAQVAALVGPPDAAASARAAAQA